MHRRLQRRSPAVPTLTDSLLTCLAVDGLGVALLIRAIYYRIYRKTDLCLTFFIFNLLELSYENTSRVTPFVSTDLFYRLGQDGEAGGFDQIRYKGGVNLALSKLHTFDLFLQKDAALNNSGESSALVIGATYKLKLSRNTKPKD